MVRSILILLIVFCFFNLFGIDKSHFVFKNIDNKQGLTQNGVLAIFQDRDGYMWLGTHYGLNRFDGFEIQTYYKGDSKLDLAGNTIVSIVQDSIGNIWIATYEGISVYNPVKEQFFNLSKYESKEGIFNQTILSMKFIDNHILLSSNDGIWKINRVNSLFSEEMAINVCGENFCHKLQTDIKLQSPKIYSKDGDNTYWLTANNHVIASKIAGNKLLVIDEIKIDQSSNIELTTFYKDNVSNLWVGTDMHGLYKIIENKGKYTSAKIYPKLNSSVYFSRITDILQDNEKNLWITSRSHGVIIIPKKDLGNDIITPNKLSKYELQSQKIKSIFKSRDNTLWLGSLGNGVFYFNSLGIKFSNYQINDNSSNTSVRSINKDSFNRLWIGTLFEGLYIFNTENKEVLKSLLKNSSVFALTEIDDKHFLAGCSDGLYLISFSNENINAEKILINNELSGPIFSISNKSNRYWIGTGTKLISFDLTDNYKASKIESFNNELLLKSKSQNTIRCVKYDVRNNCIWIGFEMSGLAKVSLDSQNNIREIVSINEQLKDSILLSPYICDIHFDGNNNCWVATRNGLAYLKISSSGVIKEVDIYSSKDGLPSNMIQSIRSDEHNNLWLGTNRGLVRFNKLSHKSIIYEIFDGVQDYEFAEHSSYVDLQGTMYFGGINGVSEFSPEKLNLNDFIEKVLIKDVFVNGISVKKLKEFNSPNLLTLAFFENNIKFDFISFNYINPLKCRYAFMLDGYDTDWNYTTADKRSAEYTNIPKGNYTFKVKAINEDGVWSTNYTSLPIEIKPSFWFTLPAFIIYTLILSSLIIVVVSITKRRVKRKHEQTLKKEYHDKIEKINQAKLQFFINISHEIRTPLTLIVCSVEKLITNFRLNKKQEKEVVTINRNVNRMLQLTNELLEIRKIETGNYQLSVRNEEIVQFIRNIIIAFESLAEKLNISLTVESYKEEVFLWIDVNAIEKVLFNFVSNAIKYTKSGGFVKIVVNPSKNGDFLDISVIDSGIGITAEHLPRIFDRFYHLGGNKDSFENGFGIGLSLSKNLIELHKGFISVSSEPDKGSSFTISLPMNETMYSSDDMADNVIWKTDFSPMIEILEKQKLEVENETIVLPKYEIDNIDSTKALILIVDDNEELLQNVSDYLSEIYNVIVAPNGKIGFEMAIQNQPDVILSDIVMPEMNGFELCNKIKNNINTSHIPVILLTARGDSDSQFESIEIGADYFIPKPFNIKLLSLRIRKVIESREKLRKLFSSNQYSNLKEITTNTRDEQFIDKLLKYVNEHISEPDLNINFIADSLGMSRSTFFRKIKSITGTTGKDFVDSVRLKRATELLIGSDLNISEIAYDIGHSSPLYFSKWFKSHYKISPTEYVSKYKKSKN
jgi:signal transduction histidine kinase/ligand-binding sensor domain-containing protein/CheY-like chemotaxis protein/AraC-like DNA-binding protein